MEWERVGDGSDGKAKGHYLLPAGRNRCGPLAATGLPSLSPIPLPPFLKNKQPLPSISNLLGAQPQGTQVMQHARLPSGHAGND